MRAQRADQGEQWEAVAKLAKIGLPAFHDLIEHLGDQEFCMSLEMPDSGYNFSVGQACYRIMKCNLMPYGIYNATLGEGWFMKRRPRPMYSQQYKLYEPYWAYSWWQERRNKSLRELQLEVLDWTIAEEERSPADFTEEERAFLKACRKKLFASGKAYEPARVLDGDAFY